MEISVCITVLNEETTIKGLLEALLNQSKKPDEIVIVDGGSSDKTLSEISKFKNRNSKKNHRTKSKIQNNKTQTKVIKTKNTSIAKARNISIENARGKIIALTDAGCVPKKDWLEKITYPFAVKSVLQKFKNNTSQASEVLVAGYYEMPYKNNFQEAARLFLGVPEVKFDRKTFLPSARSVAFTKTVWERVGGFNEKLDKGGEDTEFFYKCVRNGVKIVRVGDAKVVWKDIENLSFKEFVKKVYVYAKGDGQANIWWHPQKQLSSHNIKISLIYLRYFIGFILVYFAILNPLIHLVLFIFLTLYVVWPIWKWRDLNINFQTRLWLPVLQFISDFAVMSGFLAGVLTSRNQKPTDL